MDSTGHSRHRSRHAALRVGDPEEAQYPEAAASAREQRYRWPPAGSAPRGYWSSLVAMVVLFCLVLALVCGLLFAPLFDESDMAITFWQAVRVLQGQQPYVDFVPIYGPAQQYATAAFLATFGRDIVAARLCTFCFVLLSAGVALGLARSLGFGLPASLGFATASLCLTGAELTPQATYMLGPAALLAVYFVVSRSCHWGEQSALTQAAPLLAGTASGFALGAKPNVGAALIVGTVAGVFWPSLGRRGRLVAALACSLSAAVPFTGAMPPASAVPYVAGPALLVALAWSSPASVKGICSLPMSRWLDVAGYLGSALATAAVFYHVLLTPDGWAGAKDWLARLSRHSSCAIPSELLWPASLYARVGVLLAGAVVTVTVIRRFGRASPLGVAVWAGLAMNLGSFLLLMRGVNAMRALALWLPSATVLALGLLRCREGGHGLAPSTSPWESLAPMGVVLLVSVAGPSYAGFENSASSPPSSFATGRNRRRGHRARRPTSY